MAVQTPPQVTRMSIDEVRRRMNELLFVDARSATALAPPQSAANPGRDSP